MGLGQVNDADAQIAQTVRSKTPHKNRVYKQKLGTT